MSVFYLSLKDFAKGKFITFMTKHGVIKKTDLEAYSNPRAGGIIAINLDEEDELISTRVTYGTQNLFIGTKLGKAIHFPEAQIRDMGRTARGIRGIKISKGDEVVGMEVVAPHTQILTATENGYGKPSQASEYRMQNRGGSGIFTVKRTQKTGNVVAITPVVDEDELMVISSKGKIEDIHRDDDRTPGGCRVKGDDQRVGRTAMGTDERGIGSALQAELEVLRRCSGAVGARAEVLEPVQTRRRLAEHQAEQGHERNQRSTGRGQDEYLWSFRIV